LPERYRQAIAAIGATGSKTLVNNGSIKVVNIPSTKMMKEFSAPYGFVRPRSYGFPFGRIGSVMGKRPLSIPSLRAQRSNPAFRFAARWIASLRSQ